MRTGVGPTLFLIKAPESRFRVGHPEATRIISVLRLRSCRQYAQSLVLRFTQTRFLLDVVPSTR